MSGPPLDSEHGAAMPTIEEYLDSQARPTPLSEENFHAP